MLYIIVRYTSILYCIANVCYNYMIYMLIMYISNIYVYCYKWEPLEKELFLKKHLKFCFILYLQKYIFRGMI